MTEAFPTVRREVNLNIARVAASFVTPGVFEFLCECHDPACQQFVTMTLETFSAGESVVVQGHYAA